MKFIHSNNNIILDQHIHANHYDAKKVGVTAHMTQRFLTNVNTYISGSNHGRFILIINFCRKTNPQDHE